MGGWVSLFRAIPLRDIISPSAAGNISPYADIGAFEIGPVWLPARDMPDVGKVAVEDSSAQTDGRLSGHKTDQVAEITSHNNIAVGESCAQTEVGHSETSMCRLGLQCGPRPASFYGPCAITMELLRQTKREMAKHRPVTLAAAETADVGARGMMASVTADDPRCYTAARSVVVASLTRKAHATVLVQRRHEETMRHDSDDLTP